METKTGIIKALKFKSGYGFIRQDDGTDIFFHVSGLISPRFNELKEGQSVEFLVEEGPRGPKAIGVVATVVAANK